MSALAKLRERVATTARSQRLLFLDAMRGFAALAVAVEHVYLSLPASTHETVPRSVHACLSFGGNGVAVFFVLSGSVIPYAIADARVTPRYIGRFIARRFIRLDVPYWLTIFLYLLAARIMGKTVYQAVDAPILAANMFYLNFLLGWQAVVQVGWTLALEIQFYIAYLIFLGVGQALTERVAFLRSRRHAARLLAFAPSLIVTLLWQFGVIADAPGPDVFFLQPWLFFLCGAALMWVNAQGFPAWPAALTISALGASGVMHGDSASMVGAATAVCIWWVWSHGTMTAYTAGRFGQWLGTISYSLYLLHPLVGSRPIRTALGVWPAPWSMMQALAAATTGLVASLLVAHVFCRMVEQPSQRLARRVRLTDAVAEVPAAPTRAGASA